jgi:hypothetical protein
MRSSRITAHAQKERILIHFFAGDVGDHSIPMAAVTIVALRDLAIVSSVRNSIFSKAVPCLERWR